MFKFYSFLLILLTFFSVFTQAKENIEKNMFSNTKINIDTSANPIFFIQNIGTGTRSGSGNNRWITIELSYKFARQNLFPSFDQLDNMLGTDKNSFAIKFELLLPGKQKTYLLSTIIKYSAVNIDSNTKYALVLIPPQTLNGILPPRQQLNSNFLRKLNIKITFLINGVDSGTVFSLNSSKQIFENTTSDNNIIRISGGLLNRLQTPWVTINYDKYQIIRPH